MAASDPGMELWEGVGAILRPSPAAAKGAKVHPSQQMQREGGSRAGCTLHRQLVPSGPGVASPLNSPALSLQSPVSISCGVAPHTFSLNPFPADLRLPPAQPAFPSPQHCVI